MGFRVRHDWKAVPDVKPGIKDYTDLIAWQKSDALVIDLYEVTRSSPTDERFGLVQQVRRAAVSMPSNIAEGWGRGTTADDLRFLRTARGSAFELQTQVRLAVDLGFTVHAAEVVDRIGEVIRILTGLIRSIEKTDGQ